MFNMFSSYSRFASYGHRHDSSDEEEDKTPAQFALSRGTEGGATNTALEAALNSDPSAGRIALETEEDGLDVDAAVNAAHANMCVECADQPATLVCEQCEDRYCNVCFASLHKRGTRAAHKTKPFAAGVAFNETLRNIAVAAPQQQQRNTSNEESKDDLSDAMDESTAEPASSSAAAQAQQQPAHAAATQEDEILESASSEPAARPGNQRARGPTDGLSDSDEHLTGSEGEDDARSTRSGFSAGSAASHHSGHSSTSAAGPIVLPTKTMNSSLLGGTSAALPEDWFVHRAKYIPMRLTLEERKFLRLLEATLNVSEYTDKIDIVSNKDKLVRIKEQLRDLCSILSGLVVANDYKLGQKLLKDKDFADNAEFFRSIFELGRRHKIRNPEKMRNVYGKLVFILQDSVNPAVEELMGFHLVAPLKTAYSTLEAGGALDCLKDPKMMQATGDIKTEGRQRYDIERDTKAKYDAVTYLAKKYQNSKIDEEGIRACILSIADNHTFLMQNRFCCDVMLQWLTELYDANEPRAPWSLAILGGRQGARLTHTHSNQYAYVMQSLTLWREILHDFFALWCKSEEDLMDATNPYRLRNTGQGLNRVQSAPRVGKAMHNILYHCQRKLGHWVGSSVIHLGDHNVPNSLIFIDKYSQVSRILNPIVLTIKAITRLCEKNDVKFYIDSIFGGAEKLKLLILTDFFRHAFDGSGADNFFDAGSCIDGRLTSAWNWCSKLEKKSYYPIFQLAGFSSFDGQWSD